MCRLLVSVLALSPTTLSLDRFWHTHIFVQLNVRATQLNNRSLFTSGKRVAFSNLRSLRLMTKNYGSRNNSQIFNPPLGIWRRQWSLLRRVSANLGRNDFEEYACLGGKPQSRYHRWYSSVCLPCIIMSKYTHVPTPYFPSPTTQLKAQENLEQGWRGRSKWERQQIGH